MADRVYTVRERPFDDLQHVGIVITLLRERPGQRHVGILHKDESTKEVRVLHLAWHNKLKNNLPKSSYAWVDPPILERRARQVAAFCRRVYRANSSGIPYAFSPASDCFSEHTGKFLLGPNRNGLTCSSFVLGVFHSAGLPLIQYDTWPESREGDDEWQRYIIDQLTESGAALTHIRAVQSEVAAGAVRYRPEEVAGAGTAEDLPAPFVEVRRLADEILVKLRTNNLYTA
jgi:hypothetical protein